MGTIFVYVEHDESVPGIKRSLRLGVLKNTGLWALLGLVNDARELCRIYFACFMSSEITKVIYEKSMSSTIKLIYTKYKISTY